MSEIPSPFSTDGYTRYLEERVRLLTEQKDTQARTIKTLLAREKSERSISMPPTVNALIQLPVGTVITWSHRYPRGDVYKFVAFLQRSNEWHMVSGNYKDTLTTEELYRRYDRASLAGFRVLS